MLMVILGAGASYDSAQAYPLVSSRGRPVGQEDEWRPPLAKDLFLDRHHVVGDIVGKYAKLTHILPYLREPSNGRSVEEMLESLQQEGKHDPETLCELAAVRFYLCELLHNVTERWSSLTNGVTNYAPLIREVLRFTIPGEQVCIVTFNYDLLLERALDTFNFRRKPPEEHLDSHPTLKLFKLHGSVNWSRLVLNLPSGTRLQPQGLIEQANTIRVSDKFVLANATDPTQMFNFGKPILPAIAIPVQTKTEQHFECPQNHRYYLVKMLPNITKILIIGWQAKEAHFTAMLRGNLPKLKHVMVVGASASDAGATLKCFLEEIRLHVPMWSASQGGFTRFIVEQEGYIFFQA
jgi:hypothetical protein